MLLIRHYLKLQITFSPEMTLLSSNIRSQIVFSITALSIKYLTLLSIPPYMSSLITAVLLNENEKINEGIGIVVVSVFNLWYV